MLRFWASLLETEVSAARDDEPRVGAVGDLAQDQLGVIVEIDPVDVRPRRHDRGDGAIRQRQHAVDHLLLDLIDHAGLGSGGDREFHLLFGDIARAPFGNAEHREQRAGRVLKQPDERPRNRNHELQRPRDARGNPLRRGERDPFWHQFAEND